MMAEAVKHEFLARVFVDTQVITLFKFLEVPERFVPDGEHGARFVVTTPVVRELERVKDEHSSSGQRRRAKKLLDLLDEADRIGGIALGHQIWLEYRYQEPSDANLNGIALRVDTPDDRFIGAVFKNIVGSRLPYFYVLSDDVGVRVRAKHILDDCRPMAPPQDLRYPIESFNLPDLVKASVRDLAREIAALVREDAEVSRVSDVIEES